jgi:putative N6-adenine-specific DNA methylase
MSVKEKIAKSPFERSGGLLFFATCPKGLESTLKDELFSLGMSEIAESEGGVHFGGGLEECYRANFLLRSASRVLLTISEFRARSYDELYSGVRKLDWSKYMTLGMTLAVDAHCNRTVMDHSLFAARRVKDAIVDQFREKFGSRPDVNVGNPDLLVNARIYRDKCTLSLDSSGESLHQRGWRVDAGEAPLKENLASALLELAGWNGRSNLVDPMCGSGTIPIEAALMALGVPAGAGRSAYGFTRWPAFNEETWKKARGAGLSGVKSALECSIEGYDASPASIRISEANAESAGIRRHVVLARRNISEMEEQKEGTVILTNPPYGERLGRVEELKELYRLLGDTLKRKCMGCTAHVLCGNPDLIAEIGLKPSRRLVLFNGPIECRLLKYEIY